LFDMAEKALDEIAAYVVIGTLAGAVLAEWNDSANLACGQRDESRGKSMRLPPASSLRGAQRRGNDEFEGEHEFLRARSVGKVFLHLQLRPKLTE
jgi:hypothetical protein